MADNTKYLQTQAYAIAGSGAIIGATSITLTSFKDIDGVDIAMTDFGTKGFATIEPASGEFEESISFTGVVQNANGTATLTGVKNVSFKYPYTETAGLLKSHAGGVTVIITNTAGFYDTFANKNNDETIAGIYTFTSVPNTAQDPVSGDDLARRSWVLSVVNGGPVSVNAVIVSGIAGETITKDQLVYLKVSDGRWWLCDADTAATVENVVLGLAQGAGSAAGAITGGVLTQGFATLTAYTVTANTQYYASNTAGGISTTPGTKEVTIGTVPSGSTTTILFYPRFDQTPTEDELDAMLGTSGTPSNTNRYVTQADPVYSSSVANKKAMTAGETINGATLPVPVYQDPADGQIYACDANVNTKYHFIGFAITNGTDNNPITVQFNGIVTGFSGLTQGVQYYVQDAVGTIDVTPGSMQILVGVAISATEIAILKGTRITSGTANFANTGTQAVTTGFRPSKVMVYATCDNSEGASSSWGSWSVAGGNQCAWVSASASAAGSATSAGTNSTAWKIANPTDGSDVHTGTITTITNTGFTLDDVENAGSTTVFLMWIAEGEL